MADLKRIRSNADRARDVIAQRSMRHRNRLAGKCCCGRARDRALKNGALGKTCGVCYNLAANRVRFRAVGVPREPLRRMWVKLTTEHDSSTLAEWQDFIGTYGMPIETAIESAMELLIALTAQHEAQQHAQDVEQTAFELEQSA
jgi:hypothetical protein